MRNLKPLLLLVMITLLGAVEAQAVSLYVWKFSEALAPMIIPVREGESSTQAVANYLIHVQNTPDLLDVFKGRLPRIANGQILMPLFLGNKRENTLIMANSLTDYTHKSERLVSLLDSLQKRQQRGYILPIAAGISLSPAELEEYHKLLTENFSMLITPGGDDTDPSLSGDETLYSRKVSPTRDYFEVAAIRSYIEAQAGFVVAICRGFQLVARVFDYSLTQDIPIQIGKSVHHADHNHDIQLSATSNNIFQSLVREIPEQNLFVSQIKVNSFHHQAFTVDEYNVKKGRYAERGLHLEVAATTPDGVIEAAEFSNGLGIIFQFHPEYMHNSFGRQIIFRAIDRKNEMYDRSCKNILEG